VKVYQVLLIYKYLSSSFYQVGLLLQQTNQTHQKAKNLDSTQPSPAQPNPWVDPTHGQL